MFRKQILFAASVVSLIAVPVAAAEAKGTKFPLPDGTVGLYVTAANASGDVAGSYLTGGKFSHSYGFIRRTDGSFVTIDLKSYRHNTTVEAIDDAGDVAGLYETPDNPLHDHAFLRTPDGAITSFDAPGAYDTQPFDINSTAGAMVGWYYTKKGNHAFVRTMDGTLTTIDYPGATGTYAYAINANGQITGTYLDSQNVRHGFLREPDGSFQGIDPPYSGYTDNVVINDAGLISGIYQDIGSGTYYAFVRDHEIYYPFDRYFGRLNARHQAVGQLFRLHYRYGQFKTRSVKPPNGCFNLYLDGINDNGLISGALQCGAGTWFGYLARK